MTGAAYYQRLSTALVQAELHRPVLVIDRDRLDGNIELVRKRLAPGLGLRIVDKSLSSIPLMQHILSRCDTMRIMSFHLPMTLAMLSAFPEAEVLFGKPVPIATLTSSLNHSPPEMVDDVLRRCVFLIDDMARLEQYAALAHSSGKTIRIAFEVDVGMHRGGFQTPQTLLAAVARAGEASGLRLEGVMAYEAHIPQLPRLFGGAYEQVRVEARLNDVVAALPPKARNIVNTGGSKTALTYGNAGTITEVSMGSAFLKPTDFEIETLCSLQPAAFIATPILKVGDMRLPGPAFLTYLTQAFGSLPKKGCFLYGGKWMAEPVHPRGLQENRLWGHSSNQQMMALPHDTDARPDDFAIFRPTQSEAVLQHFDGLYVMSGGRIEERWPVLPAG
ncbi:D-serine deaminase-like pyridoxal phosphate-dependent protein [Rhizobium sp. AG855]|nr:alanine racemase [Rhizobium sp. AG855]RKE79212.1 D-serine deaminase-like pyridoxal phosphate-dependent protein [Rhizobium sp. AG855]